MIKRIFLFVAAAILFFSVPALAAANIQLIDDQISEKELVVKSGDKMMLAKAWYTYSFEVNENRTAGSLEMKAVDKTGYEKALSEVTFPLEAVGDYKIYFLDYRLKNYAAAQALSFMDNSCVVFGTYYDLSLDKLHQLAVHEMGHQVDFHLMTGAKWSEYNKLRGLTDSAKYNNTNSTYENRPQEIFAEDFRLLFGGENARKITHLNKTLPHPETVQGLKDFYLSLL